MASQESETGVPSAGLRAGSARLPVDGPTGLIRHGSRSAPGPTAFGPLVRRSRSVTSCFRFGHLSIACDMALPEVVHEVADRRRVDLELIHVATDIETWMDDEPGSSLLSDGAAGASPFSERAASGLAVYETVDGWLFTVGEAAFHLFRGARVLAHLGESAVMTTAERYALLDQVLPYVLAIRGDAVLHASAVVVGTRAIAFAGASGVGKSTLATALGLRDQPLLTDDCVAVSWDANGPRVEPSYSSVRLWPDSVDRLLADPGVTEPMAPDSPKVRAHPAAVRFAQDGAALGGVLMLRRAPDHEPDKLELVQMSAGASSFALIQSAFVLARSRAERISVLDRFVRLASAVRVATLTVPNDYERLPDVMHAVWAWVASEPAP